MELCTVAVEVAKKVAEGVKKTAEIQQQLEKGTKPVDVTKKITAEKNGDYAGNMFIGKIKSEVSDTLSESLNKYLDDKRLSGNSNVTDWGIKTLETNQGKIDFNIDKDLEVGNESTTKYSIENSLNDYLDSKESGGEIIKASLDNEVGGNEKLDSVVKQNNPRSEIVDGVKNYYDSNGDLYRQGNDLSPNNEYELNDYKYKTDEQGRITSAEGKLHLKDREGRLTIKDSIEDIGKGDEKDGDDRGHLIGDQFDGSNGMENMVPQDSTINRNDFKNFENELAKEVKDGKEVEVQIEPVYDGDSRRPSNMVVTYRIDGEVSFRVFPNSKEV